MKIQVNKKQDIQMKIYKNKQFFILINFFSLLFNKFN